MGIKLTSLTTAEWRSSLVKLPYHWSWRRNYSLGINCLCHLEAILLALFRWQFTYRLHLRFRSHHYDYSLFLESLLLYVLQNPFCHLKLITLLLKVVPNIQTNHRQASFHLTLLKKNLMRNQMRMNRYSSSLDLFADPPLNLKSAILQDANLFTSAPSHW